MSKKPIPMQEDLKRINEDLWTVLENLFMEEFDVDPKDLHSPEVTRIWNKWYEDSRNISSIVIARQALAREIIRLGKK